jgi:hypothetical protein
MMVRKKRLEVATAIGIMQPVFGLPTFKLAERTCASGLELYRKEEGKPLLFKPRLSSGSRACPGKQLTENGSIRYGS